MKIYMNSNAYEQEIRSLVMSFTDGQIPQIIVEQQLLTEQDEILAEERGSAVVCLLGEAIRICYYEQGVCLQMEEEPTASKERKPLKDQLKRVLYRVLQEQTGRQLPWGTLTGIRPTKIARVALEQGQTPQMIEEHLRDTYYMSEDKINLSLRIARTELDSLKPLSYQRGYSLYVGIPFCPSTCAYCSFTSYPLGLWKDKVDLYVEKLCEEIKATTAMLGRDRITTIYIGGGTPTTLLPHQLDQLLGVLREVSETSVVHEFTVEAGRPDSVTKEKLEMLHKHGVTRISINPQTMKQETLNRIGRWHTVEQTVEAFQLARSLGFDNINMDMIVGLPGEEYEDVEQTLQQIGALQPDSLTVHSLAVKRAARLNTKKELFVDYQSVNNRDIMELTHHCAKQMDMIPYYLYRQKNMAGNYENVGYAKTGKIGLYNILIMEEMQTIAAVGAGASTKVFIPSENRIERVENVKDVGVYLERFDEMVERKRAAFAREEGRLFS